MMRIFDRFHKKRLMLFVLSYSCCLLMMAECPRIPENVSHIKVYSEPKTFYVVSPMRWEFGRSIDSSERPVTIDDPDEIREFMNNLDSATVKQQMPFDVYDSASETKILIRHFVGPNYGKEGYRYPIGYAIIHWKCEPPELIWFSSAGIDRGKVRLELTEYFKKLLFNI